MIYLRFYISCPLCSISFTSLEQEGFLAFTISTPVLDLFEDIVYIFFDSSLMFKDLCSSGLTQKVQHWKLFVSSLLDPQGKQFFLILSAQHKAHFPQHKNKSYHSPSSLVGSLTNFVLSNCFWLTPSRFQASFSSWWTLGEWGFSDSCS